MRIIYVLLVICLVVSTSGCMFHSSRTIEQHEASTSSTSMSGNLFSTPSPAYLQKVPNAKPPITQARFDKISKIEHPSYSEICKLLGDRGTDVSKEAGARQGEHIYAWKNSATSYVQVTISNSGKDVASSAYNL